MKKLIIALLFAAFLPHAALAVPGPAQWSLAGVASWAQPLTASGTALPATSTYAIGDLFALYGGAASTTFELYRLCASGTAGVWRNTGSGGTDTTTAAALAAHVASGTDPHGQLLTQGDLHVEDNLTIDDQCKVRFGKYFWPSDAYYGELTVIMNASDTVFSGWGFAVVASHSVAEGDTVAIFAPASSTQVVGITYDSADGGLVPVQIAGEGNARVASDSETINPGDWVITSDTTPGYVMRASTAGDVPLSAEESQRRVGYATGAEYYSGTATYTWIVLKGNR